MEPKLLGIVSYCKFPVIFFFSSDPDDLTYDAQGGLGLWNGPIIDAHFRERGRQVKVLEPLLHQNVKRAGWCNWCGTQGSWNTEATGASGWTKIQGWNAGSYPVVDSFWSEPLDLWILYSVSSKKSKMHFWCLV